jgi:hypothetical protein
MSLHSDTLFWFQSHQSLLLLPILVSGLTRPRLDSSIYHTRSEHADYYTNDAVEIKYNDDHMIKKKHKT